MTTLADLAGYRRVEVSLHQAYESDLRNVTEHIAGAPPESQRDTLIRAFPELVLPGVKAMQDFASSWAEDLYAEKSTRIGAPRLALPADDLLEATVRWAVGPAFGTAAGTVFDNLAGAGQRYIADAGREVVVSIEPRSRSGRGGHTELRRFPSAGACDWCMDTAGIAVGSHDHCHCVIGPVFRGDSI